MVLSVLLAAILDFLRDSWPGLGTWNSSKQKWYFEHKSQVCVSAVHPDMMYNPDNWDFICYFGGHFVFQFWKGKTKNRAWHGADLESAYPNCRLTYLLINNPPELALALILSLFLNLKMHAIEDSHIVEHSVRVFRNKSVEVEEARFATDMFYQ